MTDFFDFVGQHYELYRAVDPSKIAARAQAVVDFAARAHRPRHRLAELCCGDGRHSRALARHGMEVVGVDRSGVLLERARSLTDPGSRVSFLRQDLLELALGEPVDLAVAFGHSFGLALDETVTCRQAARVRSNLTACGLAYLHVFETPGSPAPAPLERTLRLPEGTLCEQVTYDVARRERSTTVTVRKDNGVAETARIAVRTWRTEQLSALLARAGLQKLDTTKDGILGSPSGFGVWVTPT